MATTTTLPQPFDKVQATSRVHQEDRPFDGGEEVRFGEAGEMPFDGVQKALVAEAEKVPFDGSQEVPSDGAEEAPFNGAEEEPFAESAEEPSPRTEAGAWDEPSVLPQGVSKIDETLHRRALEHLQVGEWEAAIQCLTTLVKRHPDQEYYRNLLQQATLKAGLGDTLPRRRTGRSMVHSRGVWAAVILSLVLGVSILGLQLYQKQIVPALQQRQVIRRQQELLEEGRQLLAAGEFEEAAARFEEVSTLNPDNPVARKALDEINRRQGLAQAYDAAMALIEQEAWDLAIEALEAIQEEAPGYRDVQQQINRATELRELSSLFEEATRLVDSSNWQAAVKPLLRLQEEAPDYKPETVKTLLIDSYMKMGKAALSDAVLDSASEIERVQEAISAFTKALELDPTNADAAVQAELAQEYLAALEAYHRENWELAGIHLANVYPIASDYANGRAAELLQAVYVEVGSRYRHKEEPGFTAERFRQAIALSLIGDARPLPDGSEELLRIGDDLFQQGRYHKAAIAYGNILGMMGFEGVASDEALELEEDQEEPVPVEPTPVPEWYIVQPGDTLSGIARRFNTTVAALLEANAIIQNPNLIRPGWRLLVGQS